MASLSGLYKRQSVLCPPLFVCVCVCIGKRDAHSPVELKRDQPENGIVYSTENCFQEKLECAAVDGLDSADISQKISETIVVRIMS